MIPGPAFRKFRRATRGSTWGVVSGAGSSSGSSSVTGVGAVLTADSTLTFTYTNNSQTVNASSIRHNSPEAPSITDTLGRPFEISFTTGPGFVPVVGADISVDLGPGPLFEGTILTVTESYQNKTQNPFWKAVVADYTYLFNKRRPFGKWVNTSASIIANYLISCYAPGFTGAGIQGGLPPINLTLDGNQDMSSVFMTIAQKFKGTFRLKKKDVQLYISEPIGSILSVTDSNILINSPVQYTVDTSQLRTRVYVKSGSITKVAADVPSGATEIPVEDISKLPSSGTALIDGQLIRFSGVNNTTVVEDTQTYPKPTSSGNSSSSGLGNKLSYPAGTYNIYYSFVYPDGHETSAIGPSQVTLDGIQALRLDNIPQPPVGSNATINVFISTATDNGADGTVGSLGNLSNGTTSIDIPMTPHTGGTHPFGILWTPPDTSVWKVFGGSALSNTWNNYTPKVFLDSTDETGAFFEGVNGLPVGFTVISASITSFRDTYGYEGGGDIVISEMGNWNFTIKSVSLPMNASGSLVPIDYPPGTTAFHLLTELYSVSYSVDFTNGFPSEDFFSTGPRAIKVTGTFTILSWSGSLPKGDNLNGVKKIKVNDPSIFCQEGGQAMIGGKVISYTSVQGQYLTGITTGGPGSIGCCPVSPGASISPYNNSCGTTPPPTNPVDPLSGGYGTNNEPITGTTPSDTTTTAANSSQSNGSLIGCSPLACGSSGILPIAKGATVQLWVQVDDFQAQSDAAAREGGDGIHEYVLDAPRAITLFDCQNAGMIELLLLGYPVETLIYDTHDQNTASGKMVNVSLSVPTVSGNFKIQSVQVLEINASPSSNTPPKYRVSASSVRFNMQDLLNRLLLEGAL